MPVLSFDALPALSPGQSIYLHQYIDISVSPYSSTALSSLNIRNDSVGGGYLRLNGVRLPEGNNTIDFFRDSSSITDSSRDFRLSQWGQLEFVAGSTAFTDRLTLNGSIDGWGSFGSRTGYITSMGPSAPTPQPVVSIDSSYERTTSEGGSSDFTVRLSEAASQDVRVDYRIVGTGSNPASPGVDTSGLSGSITIRAGQTVGTIVIGTRTDSLIEGTERYRVELTGSSGGNATVSGQNTAYGAIFDTTAPPPPPPTPAPSPSVSIDNSFERTAVEGSSSGFTVRLSEASTQDIRIDYRVVGTGSEAASPGSDVSPSSSSIIIRAGQTSGTIMLSALADDQIESTERYAVELTGVTGGNATLSAARTATGAIFDATEPPSPGTLSIRALDAVKNEGDAGTVTEFTFVVTRSGGTEGAVSADWRIDPGYWGVTLGAYDATPSDFAYYLGAQRVSFADGESGSRTIVVRVLGDGITEGDERFHVDLHSPEGGATLGTSRATGNILNDDRHGFIDPIGNGDMTGQSGDADGWYISNGLGENALTYRGHYGVDWNIEGGVNDDSGQIVKAVYDGEVIDVLTPRTADTSQSGGWGGYVMIEHTMPDGSRFVTMYGHVSASVVIGATVGRGDTIGTLYDYDGSGPRTAHLHFEVRGSTTDNGEISTATNRAYLGYTPTLSEDRGVPYFDLNGTRFYDGEAFIDARSVYWSGTAHGDLVSVEDTAVDVGGAVGFSEEDDVLSLVSPGRHYALGGHDRVNGSSGNDTVFGGAGADSLFGAGGRDRLIGNAGNDRLYGQSGYDSLAGGYGRDRLYGGYGEDSLYGQRGYDRLYGQKGSDLLSGGAGNDRLFGGAGNDRLGGGAGNDRLVGGSGRDTMSGGSGADDFVFVRGFGRDRVNDFSSREGDDLFLSSRLWRGEKTAIEVVEDHAIVSGNTTILRFSSTEVIRLVGVNDLDALADSILIL